MLLWRGQVGMRPDGTIGDQRTRFPSVRRGDKLAACPYDAAKSQTAVELS